MKVAVLGGTGFIGWHVVEALLKKGADVAVFNRGRTRQPAPFSQPVKRVPGDRDKPESLGALLTENYDAVVDLSGYSREHVATPARLFSQRIGHYLFCGTSASYQPAPGGRYAETAAVSRESRTYGGDKAQAEDLLLNSPLKATVLRAHGVLGRFGGGQALYIAQRQRLARPILLRPGTASRRLNFVAAEDLAECFVAAIGRPETFGQIFNVAGDDACTPAELAALIGDARLIELSPEVADAVPELGLSWMTRDLVLENAKIKATLGVSFRPLGGIVDGILRWAKEHPRLLRWSPQRYEKKAAGGAGAPPAWLRLVWRLF